MPALLFKGVFLHSPHNDGSSVVVVRLVPDTLIPGLLTGAVEDDEMAFVHGATQKPTRAR